MHRSRRFCLVAGLTAVALLAGNATAQQGGSEASGDPPQLTRALPEECAAQLIANGDAIQRASFTYAVTTERQHNAPGAAGTESSSATTELQLSDGKFYSRTKTVVRLRDQRTQSGIFEMSFDGSVFYSGTPPQDGGGGSVLKLLGDNSDDSEARKIGFASL